MFEVDRGLAKSTLAGMPLDGAIGRFAAWWLSRIGEDGRPVTGTPLGEDLAASTLVLVGSQQSVFCRRSGDRINRALGMDLTGWDLIAVMPPEDRPERLSRMNTVMLGGLLFSYRSVVSADGTKYFLPELTVPCPDAPAGEGGVGIAFIDFAALHPEARVVVGRGALDVADDALVVDLRHEGVRSAA
jgi:hypothetical protein